MTVAVSSKHHRKPFSSNIGNSAINGTKKAIHKAHRAVGGDISADSSTQHQRDADAPSFGSSKQNLSESTSARHRHMILPGKGKENSNHRATSSRITNSNQATSSTIAVEAANVNDRRRDSKTPKTNNLTSAGGAYNFTEAKPRATAARGGVGLRKKTVSRSNNVGTSAADTDNNDKKPDPSPVKRPDPSATYSSSIADVVVNDAGSLGANDALSKRQSAALSKQSDNFVIASLKRMFVPGRRDPSGSSRSAIAPTKSTTQSAKYATKSAHSTKGTNASITVAATSKAISKRSTRAQEEEVSDMDTECTTPEKSPLITSPYDRPDPFEGLYVVEKRDGGKFRGTHGEKDRRREPAKSTSIGGMKRSRLLKGGAKKDPPGEFVCNDQRLLCSLFLHSLMWLLCSSSFVHSVAETNSTVTKAVPPTKKGANTRNSHSDKGAYFPLFEIYLKSVLFVRLCSNLVLMCHFHITSFHTTAAVIKFTVPKEPSGCGCSDVDVGTGVYNVCLYHLIHHSLYCSIVSLVDLRSFTQLLCSPLSHHSRYQNQTHRIDD
jgi:hypothetical protein